MEFVHESIIKRSKIFEAVRAGFFEPLKKEHLAPWVQLFKELTELGHAVTPRWNAEDIMNEPLYKLLFDILTVQIAIWEFP